MLMARHSTPRRRRWLVAVASTLVGLGALLLALSAGPAYAQAAPRSAAIQILRGDHGGMQVVLTEDVPHLGKQGDLVEVRPGYGRNYLLPRGMATVPTAHNLRLLDRYKIRVQQAREAKVADLRALAEQIAKLPGITVEANANEEGHLYGFDGLFFTCVGLEDGEKAWRVRGYANGQVLLLADQGLLLIVSEAGEVSLVEAKSEKHNRLAMMKAIKGKTWNHPVVAHGRLFVRNGEEVACFELPPAK